MEQILIRTHDVVSPMGCNKTVYQPIHCVHAIKVRIQWYESISDVFLPYHYVYWGKNCISLRVKWVKNKDVEKDSKASNYGEIRPIFSKRMMASWWRIVKVFIQWDFIVWGNNFPNMEVQKKYADFLPFHLLFQVIWV